jgi:hypothetical protein
MKHIYRLIAEPCSGSTVDAVARELLPIMREYEIPNGRIIHNDRRYDVQLQPDHKITPLDGEPERNR